MKVLTANTLSDGIAVWYSGSHWSLSALEAEVATDAAAENRLTAIGALAYANNEVVDVNLVDVVLKDGKPHLTRLRERIRADGPTIDYAGKSAAEGI
jgi:Protein of unknown function (DUF2849)